VTLTRGGHGVAGKVAGIVGPPVGQPDVAVLLPAGAVSRLDGNAGCAEVAVQLRRRSEATAFRRDAKEVLGAAPRWTYDESLRGHV
jgi:hypothetical protein